MDKQYQHLQHETKISQLWQKAVAFNPDSPSQPANRQLANRQPANHQPTNRQPVKTTKPIKSPPHFSILLPPPNANNPLHIGHAMYVIEDVLIRYHKMLGDDTLWLPGTDHAGIETQFVFEKKLQQQNKSRFDYDRQTLYQLIWDYVQENSDIVINQLKQLGFSLDWSRFKFMLDKDIVKIVTQTFQDLAKQKLVYRAIKLVNYCTHCGTGFSELEINHVEKKATLYYLKYGPFTLATTRPETKFGDTAVAVHPDDKRYQAYIGQNIEVEGLLGKFKLKVIADQYVDPKFGTGVVKITPAHDFNDFDVWQRHQDEIPGLKQVIDYHGHLTALAGPYQGMYLLKARKIIVADLQKKGLIEKIDETYHHNISTCYRCGTIIEPLPLPQFFIKVKPLTQKVLQALKKGDLKIHGAGYDKILKHWLENLKDWNISRQIVWGIRMPVWYNTDNPDIQVIFIDKNKHRIEGALIDVLYCYKGKYSLSEIASGLQELRAPITTKYLISPTSPGANYLQETDTFDTWFSSAQWPFTTLTTSTPQPAPTKPTTDSQPTATQVLNTTSPTQTTHTPNDFNRFYPISVMETGYDILPFWVMRMLMLGLHQTNQVPFQHVYLHGLIRDKKGQKMSKSKNNVTNPLAVTKLYGADALRMALVIRSTPGLDKSIGDQDFKAMRNLTNKIWNSTRFIITHSQLANKQASTTNRPNHNLKNNQHIQILNNHAPQDKQFFQQLDKLIQEITHQLDNFLIGLAADTIYNQFWHWFCDECLEKSKQGQISHHALTSGLIVFLKLFQPFMPFVTQAAWQELIKADLINIDQANHPLITLSIWPQTQPAIKTVKVAKAVKTVEAVKAVKSDKLRS